MITVSWFWFGGICAAIMAAGTSLGFVIGALIASGRE